MARCASPTPATGTTSTRRTRTTAYSWDFARLYGRTLTTFKSVPGKDGLQLVPDLAQSMGEHSADFKTWTYKLKPGVKFEDGTPVRAQDIKYDVERSLDKTVFPNGPTYFNDYLDLKGYTTPYKDKTPGKLGLKAVETPDDSTIIFHLKKAVRGASTTSRCCPPPCRCRRPRTPARTTSSTWSRRARTSSRTTRRASRMALVRNTNWDPSTDPNRKQLPDRIEVQIGVNADDIDNRLLAGSLDVDVAGTGVQAAAAARIQSNPTQKKNADAAPTARLWYTAISSDVAAVRQRPLPSRGAVRRPTRRAMQTAMGGPLTGGDVATHLMMPLIPGNKDINPYPSGPGNHGDIAKAKSELQQCGKPNGFSTVLSARTERPKEVNAALAMQQGLAKVGIKAEIKKFPQGDYFKLYAGKPDYVKKNGLGLMMMAWGADWPEGFGYLSQIVDSRVIRDRRVTPTWVSRTRRSTRSSTRRPSTGDINARNAIWAQIDAKVMDDAYIVPFLDVKGLLYRPPGLKNAYVNQGLNGLYDYANLGVK